VKFSVSIMKHAKTAIVLLSGGTCRLMKVLLSLHQKGRPANAEAPLASANIHRAAMSNELGHV
jgi:hypothetical protein